MLIANSAGRGTSLGFALCKIEFRAGQAQSQDQLIFGGRRVLLIALSFGRFIFWCGSFGKPFLIPGPRTTRCSVPMSDGASRFLLMDHGHFIREPGSWRYSR